LVCYPEGVKMVQDGSHKKTEDPKDQKIKVIQKKVVKSTPQPGQPEFFIEQTDTIVEGNPVFNVYEGKDDKGKFAACAYFRDGQLWEYSTNHKIQLSMNAVHRIQQEHVKYINEHPIVPEAPRAPEPITPEAPKASQAPKPTKSLDELMVEFDKDSKPRTQSVEKIGASQPSQPPKAQASPTPVRDFMDSQTQKPETKAPPKAPEAPKPIVPTAPTYVAPLTVPEAPKAPQAPKPTEAPRPTVPTAPTYVAPPKAPEVKPIKVPEAQTAPKDKDDVPIVELTSVPPAEEPKTAAIAAEVKLDPKQFVQDKDGIIYLHSSTFEVTDVGNYWLFKKDNKFYRLSDIAGEPKELKAEAVSEAACRLYNNMQAIVNSYIEIIDDDRDDITALDKELEVAEKRVETLESLEERINSEVQAKESAQSALKALGLEKENLAKDIKNYETTIAQLNEQKVDTTKYEQQLAVLKNQNVQYEKTIENLKVTAETASKAAKSWEGQYNSILKEKESTGQAAQTMKEAMLSANRNARETVVNYQALQQKYREAVQQNADLQQKLEAKQ